MRLLAAILLVTLVFICWSFSRAFAAEAPQGRDLEARHVSYKEAEEEAWRALNTGDADAIGAAFAARRASEGKLFQALEGWSQAPLPPGPLHPAVEAALLARRSGEMPAARRALRRLSEMVPPAHDDFGLVQLTMGAVEEEDGQPAAAEAAYARAAGSLRFLARDHALQRLAVLRAARGDSSGAKEAFLAVKEMTPPSTQIDRAYLWLLESSLESGDLEAAESLSQLLASRSLKGDEGAKVLLLQARVHLKTNQDRAARTAYLQLMREQPGSPLAREAWSELDEIKRQAGTGLDPEEKIAGAQVLLKSGQEELGLKFLREVIEDTSAGRARIEAAEKEGAYYYGRKQWEASLKAYAGLERIAPSGSSNLAEARLWQARCLRNAGKVLEMSRQFAAVSADTTHRSVAARAAWELAREYKSLGRFEDCESVLDDYIERHPYGDDILQALLLRGLCRFLHKQESLAAADFRELQRRAERRADKEAGAYWRARANLEDGDTLNAIRALRSALTYDLPDGYYGFGIRRLLARLASDDTVTHWVPVPLFDPTKDPANPSGLDLVPERPRAHFQRGVLLARAGFFSEAQVELNRAAELAPSDPTLLEVTAGLAARLGMYSYAMSSARRALSRVDSRAGEARLWRYVYALGHFDLVRPAAESHGLDPMLVSGLIRQESLFEPRATSRAGARGLMQLMLPTARMIARARGESPPIAEDLYRPELSVAYGTHYLRAKLAEFGDRVEVALAAYNAGEEKAREWEALLPEFDPDLYMELIDYSETKDYVRRVRYNQESLHLFYDPRGAR
jgi:soluble lytic murein transglycosylase